MKFVIHARYVDDQERLARFRAAHRAYAKAQLEAGKLLLAGPMTDGSGALFIYEGEAQEDIVALLAADPFSTSGSFASVDIRPWTLLGINHERLRAPPGT